MPLYEYQCTKCGRRVEKIQSFTAAPLAVCEACGGPMERLISAPSFRFKGSGWYVTDYGNKSGSSPAHPDHVVHNGDKAEAKSETKSESKPEPTTATAPAAPSPQK